MAFLLGVGLGLAYFTTMLAIFNHHNSMNAYVAIMNTAAIGVMILGIVIRGNGLWGLAFFSAIHTSLYIWRKSLDFPA